MTYLRDLFDNITPHTKSLHEGADCNESPCCLQLQVPWNLPKWFVLLRVLDHAVHILIRKVVLRVHQLEESLEQASPKLIEGLL